jgi:serine/threonine-protein kinase
MGRNDSDRDLLFGAIALQAGLIGPGRLAEARAAWAARPGTRLPDVLRERGWLTSDDQAAIERLLERELTRHGGDVRRALAAVADGDLVAALAEVDDPVLRIALSERTTDPGVAPPLISALDWPVGSRARYSLVRLHARGGLGRVWLAHDPAIGRDIALKELLPERVDDPIFRARFLAEARITGQLQHPSIVPVYELSRCPEDGRAFYTMRMVRGRTLSEAVRAHHAGRGGALGLSGLLNAFVAACNTIAYAHSRGVIHRDLKGRNIILGDYGEVIVLDWGLAKVVGQPEGEWPEPAVGPQPGTGEGMTLHGQAMGTPGYMAPEQANGRHELVGRATDIYGLGAVLYEILTGRPPLGTTGKPEAVRQDGECDPDPPRRVRAATPPALEAVCLKALARRPEDRYASATELAEDVRRWLADEPVSAWREPAAARWARWGRRHRTAAVAAAGVLLVGLAALGVGIVLVGRERARAEAHFRMARDEADRIYYRILGDAVMDRPGSDPLRHELTRAVQEYYRDLATARPDDPELAEHLGWSYIRLARITLRKGEPDRAIELDRLALATFEGLAKAHPGSGTYQSEVAHAHLELGQTFWQSGRQPEAEAAFDSALAIWRDLSSRRDGRAYRSELATAYDELGAVNLAHGRSSRALELHATALAIWEDLARPDGGRAPRPDILSRLAYCQSLLAGVHAAREEWGEAESSYYRARQIWEELLRRRADDDGNRRLGYALQGLGRVYGMTGRTAEADRTFAEALAIWDKLAAAHRDDVEYAANRAAIHQLQGELYDPSLHPPGQPPLAESHYLRALEILEPLLETAPRHLRPVALERRAQALTSLGQLYRGLAKPELAESYLRRAREAREGGEPRGVGREKPSVTVPVQEGASGGRQPPVRNRTEKTGG